MDKIKFLFFLFFFTIYYLLQSQNNQSEEIGFFEDLSRESQAENAEESLLPTEEDERVEEYEYYMKRPLNINQADAKKLEGLGLLSAWQIEALLSYRRDYGRIVGLYELHFIQSFDSLSVQRIAPFICFEEEMPLKWTASNMKRYGQNQALFRFGVVSRKEPAYYARYTYRFMDYFKTGIAFRYLNSKMYFASGYVAFSQKKYLKNFLIGTYHLRFGQGLCLWTSKGLGRMIAPDMMTRSGNGAQGYSGSAQTGLLRGATMQLNFGKIETHLFYSYQDEKHLAGTHLNLLFSKFRLGTTLTWIHSPKPIENIGQNLCNIGLDYNFLFRKIHFFGEIAYSHNGGFASVQAFQWQADPRFSFYLAHRYYDIKYKSIYGSSFGQSSSLNDEKGWNIGFNWDLHRKIRISGVMDFFRFDAMSYRVYAPSIGQIYQLRLEYKISSDWIAYAQYRYKNKNITQSLEEDLPQISESAKHSIRLHSKWNISHTWEFQTRWEYSQIGKEKGFLLYQDLVYRMPRPSFALIFRYAVCQTDGYNSRIYAYEGDVLYSYTSAAYYGSAQKVYVMFKYTPFSFLSFWLRLGTGLQPVKGHWKPELKIQLMAKF